MGVNVRHSFPSKKIVQLKNKAGTEIMLWSSLIRLKAIWKKKNQNQPNIDTVKEKLTLQIVRCCTSTFLPLTGVIFVNVRWPWYQFSKVIYCAIPQHCDLMQTLTFKHMTEI